MSSCDVISLDHFVRGFYNSSFRRCRPNFLVLQKEYTILVHILSTYKKLEQSTHWIIQKKWGKDFTFDSDCTVEVALVLYVLLVLRLGRFVSLWINFGVNTIRDHRKSRCAQMTSSPQTPPRRYRAVGNAVS